jgi:hypothetical protein
MTVLPSWILSAAIIPIAFESGVLVTKLGDTEEVIQINRCKDGSSLHSDIAAKLRFFF